MARSRKGRVRLFRIRRFLLGARLVAPRELRDRVDDRLPFSPGARRQHERRPRARSDDHVLGAGRAVEEVPLPERAFFPVDEQQAFAGKDEEILLRNTSAESAGKKIIFNFTMPRQAVVDLIKKQLASGL